MNRRRGRQVVGILAVPFFLTGCFGGYQMNELAIVDALAIDYSHGDYHVTAEVFNTSAIPGPGKGAGSSGGGNKTASINLIGNGKTLSDALADVSAVSSRHVFWAATQVVLVGTSALKVGMAPIMGTFLHYPQLRTTARMFVVPNDAAPVLSGMSSGLELTIGQQIRNQDRFVHNDDSRGWAPRVYDVLRWESQHGRSLVLLGLRKMSSTSQVNTALTMSASAIIGPGGVLRGWMSQRDAPAYLWLTNRFRQTFMATACPSGGDTTVYLTHMTTRTTVETRNGHLVGIHLAVRGTGKLAGQLCSGFDLINQAANRVAVSRTLAAVDWAKAHDADIFGWGQAVYRKDPALWQRLNGRWPEMFRTLPVSVTSQVTIVQGDAGSV